MGRASSRKKATRAERAAAARRKRRRRLGWPVVAIVALAGAGVAVLVLSAQDRTEAGASPPTIDDHWHAAYAVSLCGEVQEPLSDDGQDTSGIHTHDDGLIHIHPHSERYTGEGANLGAFADQVGLELDDDRIELPGGPGFDNGDDCDGAPGMVQVMVWDGAADPEGRLVVEGVEDIALGNDDLVTIAFAPEGAELAKPESAGEVPEDLPGAGPVGGDQEAGE